MKFLVDQPLGALAKWLRFCGFDATLMRLALDTPGSLPPPKPRTYLLTRQAAAARLKRPDLMVLTAPDPEGQLQEVLQHLGLTARDLCLPVLTYVFGQAQMNGRAAVVSLRRLGGPGGAAPRALFYTRLAKVALHETAHLLGASHCHRPGCLMCFSSTLKHVDALDIGFCPDCAVGLVRGRRRLLGGR